VALSAGAGPRGCFTSPLPSRRRNRAGGAGRGAHAGVPLPPSRMKKGVPRLAAPRPSHTTQQRDFAPPQLRRPRVPGWAPGSVSCGRVAVGFLLFTPSLEAHLAWG